MATGKMTFNYYQNGKYGQLPQNSPKDMEIAQDMHIKMSKKIAQLTKVIYALNTKNDENEFILQGVQDRHEEEKQQILADLQAKIQQYKNQLDGAVDHRREISLLQTRISEYEQEHTFVEERIIRMKEEAAVHMQQQQEEHTQHLQQLSQDVLRAKREFEEYMKNFDTWKTKIEERHKKALLELETQKTKELEDMQHFLRDQNQDWLNQCTQIEDKFKTEILTLQEQLARSQEKEAQIEEDFNQKLEKAQAFYKSELEALQQGQYSAFEVELSTLRKQQENLKTDFTAQEGDLRRQIDRLVRQLAEAEDVAEDHKQNVVRLQIELMDKDTNSAFISQQLHALRQEAAAALHQLHELEAELTASSQLCSSQAEDLVKKSALIEELEAKKLEQEALVKDLNSKIENLTCKLTEMEKERSSFLAKQNSLSAQQNSQFDSMMQQIEEVIVQKETMQQKYEKQLASLQQKIEQYVIELKSVEDQLSERENQHAANLKREKEAAEYVLVQTKQELQSQFSEETNKLKAERDMVMAEFERVKLDLLARCKQAEDEVSRLSSMVKESEQGLGSASSHINSLKEAASGLKAELDKTRAELKTSLAESVGLRTRLDEIQVSCKNKELEWQSKLESCLEKLTAELNSQWTEKMRMACLSLHDDLSRQKDDEKKVALEEMSRLKDQEIAANLADFQAKIAHLNQQLTDTKLQLETVHISSEEERSKAQAALEAEKDQLQAELQKSTEGFQARIRQLEELHQSVLQKTVEEKDAEKAENAMELQAAHMKDLSAHITAHKAALASMQHAGEEQRQKEVQEAERKHQLEIDRLSIELQEKQDAAMESLKKSHTSELRSARMELERAVEISKQKERDHQLCLEELKEEISRRETRIVKLKDEVKQLQAAVAALNKTIANKDKDVQRIQCETKEKLKQLDERLKGEHMITMGKLQTDHQQECQQMLGQFNKAQEILKDKISQLQIRMVEAEERYSQRESRPEDVELIERLRNEVLEREMRVKQLIEEKRFYQLELVNRETNFNKVFNSTPNVGILNPLNVPTKPKIKGDNSIKHLSAPSLGGSQRLDPLPGSPLHDNTLNPIRPLPQPGFSKKFVK